MLLGQLAERALAIEWDAVPLEARETARLALLDTLGVALAGSGTDCVSAVTRALEPTATGPATILGHATGAPPLDAALINGTAAHALDFDDCSNTMGGHPSAPIVPALLALAEAEGASGRALLLAYVTGVEVETRLGRAVNFHHYEKGWHPTSTLGAFGAAAACARLLDLDATRFATALALAASMASGLKANFGTMTKPFHVGHCARNGLLAARLAAAGMTASPAALEDPQGFLAVYNGAGTFDVERLLTGFADPLDLVEPGIAVKRHPCCASTHPAIDALLQIMGEHGLAAPEIAAIRSWTHPRRLRHTDRPDPRSGLDAKFSVQYVLARAALEGSVKIEHFTDEAARAPAVRAMMHRIEAAPHPKAVMTTDEHFFADVRVTTRSGAVHEAYLDRPLGRDRRHPLPPGALAAKFRDCAGMVLDERGVTALEAAVLGVDEIADVRALGRLLRDGLQRAAPRRAVA